MNQSILIVDDEKEIADLVEVYLQNEGYHVLKCYNGTEAINMWKPSSWTWLSWTSCCPI